MITNSKDRRYRFAIGGLMLWAHFATGTGFGVVSPILPLITDDYGISHTEAGLLVAVMMFMIGALGLPGGIVVGRLGLWRIYTFSWFMMGLMALAALSPNFPGLLALRMAYGLGCALLITATGPLIMQWFRPREAPIIISLNMASAAVGIAVSAITSAPLADLLGWERVMGLYGAVGLAGAFAWLFWGNTQDDGGGVAAPVSWEGVWLVLRSRTILLLGAADAACFSQYIVLQGWLPTFYNESRGMSLADAGFIVGLLPSVGILAVLLSGVLSLKVASKRLFFIVPGVMAGLGGLGSYLIEDTTGIYVSVIVLALGSWLYIPLLMTMPMELPEMTQQQVAIAWGWIMTATGTAAFISPLAVGAMRDALDSFIPGFLVFSVLAWFLVVVGFLLPKTGPQKAQVSTPLQSSIP